MLQFRDVDVEVQRDVQAAIVKAVLPFRERVEAAIIVFALITAARTLLRLYPKQTQQELLDALVPFLEGKQEPRGEHVSESGLVLPQGMLN